MVRDVFALGTVGLALAVAFVVTGCRDNEQLARDIGAEARTAAASRCAAGSADAGHEDDDAEREVCVDRACRAECATKPVAPGFDHACVESCRESGVCATDADCSAGKACVAVAPVVRRCAPKR